MLYFEDHKHVFFYKPFFFLIQHKAKVLKCLYGKKKKKDFI